MRSRNTRRFVRRHRPLLRGSSEPITLSPAERWWLRPDRVKAACQDVTATYRALPKTFLEAWHLQIEAAADKGWADVVRMTFLINGGALVALLALIGSLEGASRDLLASITETAAIFSLGLVLVCSAGLAQAIAARTGTGIFLSFWVKRPISATQLLSFAFLGAVSRVCLLFSILCIAAGFWWAATKLAIEVEFNEGGHRVEQVVPSEPLPTPAVTADP